MDNLRPLGCWSHNTLHRSAVIGQRTYERACRKVEWPTDHHRCFPDQEVEESHADTSLNEAFAGVVQSLSEVTMHCKRYYRNNLPAGNMAKCHCHRFHKPCNINFKMEPYTQDIKLGDRIHCHVHRQMIVYPPKPDDVAKKKN